jgi:potassium/chloride transporter 4/5/6
MNVSCFCLTWLKSSQWRPSGIQQRRWRCWYLGTGGCGFTVCLLIMFTVNPYWAAAALCMALGIYFYVNLKMDKAEWGSSLDGIRFQLALDSLIRLEESQHARVNWRPQVLILYKLRVSDELKGIERHQILQFYSCLLGQKSNGFCVVACVLEGDQQDEHALHKAQSEKSIIKTIMKREGLKGFAEVVVAPSWREGSNYIIQLTGIGGLVPNTVLLDWPADWRRKPAKAVDFVKTLSTALAEDKALLSVKGIGDMPSETVAGTIDVWWMIHDGGFMVLLSWLLAQHRIWRGCQLRVFTVTQGVSKEQAQQAAQSLTAILRQRRLGEVPVEVIIADGAMIDPFTSGLFLRTATEVGQQQGGHMPMRVQELFDLEQLSVAGTEASDLFQSTDEAKAARRSHVQGALAKASHAGEQPAESNAVHTLNKLVLARSNRAQLVIMNLPDVWGTDAGAAEEFLSYCDGITDGVDRVLFAHASGHEIFDLNA